MIGLSFLIWIWRKLKFLVQGQKVRQVRQTDKSEMSTDPESTRKLDIWTGGASLASTFLASKRRHEECLVVTNAENAIHEFSKTMSTFTDKIDPKKREMANLSLQELCHPSKFFRSQYLDWKFTTVLICLLLRTLPRTSRKRPKTKQRFWSRFRKYQIFHGASQK